MIGSTKVPATVALQETVAVPEPVIVVGLIAPQVNPDGGVSVSVTMPVNPLTAVTVIVDVSELPVEPMGDVALIVKSWTTNVTVAV